MKLQIQQGRGTWQLELADNDQLKVEHLMEEIEAKSGIFRRNQSLILKGKVLAAHQSLAAVNVRLWIPA